MNPQIIMKSPVYQQDKRTTLADILSGDKSKSKEKFLTFGLVNHIQTSPLGPSNENLE